MLTSDKILFILVITTLVINQAYALHRPVTNLLSKNKGDVIMSRVEYSKNQVINNITFLYELESVRHPNGRISRKAHFRCYCGNEFDTFIHSVKSGRAKSCGCWNIKQIKNRTTIHGLTKTPIHHLWTGIRKRCTNPKVKSYKYYGGRGIKICSEWSEFIPFYNWALANGYEQGLQIDRIDNNGNYEPSNCRFVTHAENCQNRSSTKLNWDKVNEIRAIGSSKSQSEISKMYNVQRRTINRILNNKSWITT